MASDAFKINGRCPYKQCDHFFINASEEQVGTHFRNHGPDSMPTSMAAKACLRLMDFRREQNV